MTRLVALLRRAEGALLALGVLALVVLAFVQIVLRLVLHSAPGWIDELLRHMVLWTGLLGAMAATSERRHISIDALSRWLPPRARSFTGVVTNLFASVVCVLLAWATLRFVRDEREFGGEAIASLPGWIAQAPIPIAFLIMGGRFFLGAVQDLRQAIRGVPAGTGGTEAAS